LGEWRAQQRPQHDRKERGTRKRGKQGDRREMSDNEVEKVRHQSA